MRSAKIITTVLLCLGFVVPSAHGVVLCVDDDGDLALEVAVNGACAGARPQGESARPLDAARAGLRAGAGSSCGGCRDVALGVSHMVAPLPMDTDGRRLGRPVDIAVTLPAGAPTAEGVPGGCTLCAVPPSMAHGPPLCRIVVLRL